MKQNILSFVAGILIGAMGCYAYFNFIHIQKGPGMPGGQFQMTDERLSSMADKLGITKDELKKELDSGKDIRTLMQEKGVSFGSGRGNRSGSGSGSFSGK